MPPWLDEERRLGLSITTRTKPLGPRGQGREPFRCPPASRRRRRRLRHARAENRPRDQASSRLGHSNRVDHFQGSLAWLGITDDDAAFVGEPQSNGVAERFIWTLKEQSPYGRDSSTTRTTCIKESSPSLRPTTTSGSSSAWALDPIRGVINLSNWPGPERGKGVERRLKIKITTFWLRYFVIKTGL